MIQFVRNKICMLFPYVNKSMLYLLRIKKGVNYFVGKPKYVCFYPTDRKGMLYLVLIEKYAFFATYQEKYASWNTNHI